MNIQDLITSVESRREQASELSDKAEKIEKRRREAERKNDALRTLYSELRNYNDDYQTLLKWDFLADVMEAKYNSDTLEQVEEKTQQSLREFTQKDLDDFEDADEIRDIKQNINTQHTQLDEQQQEIQRSIEDRCEKLLEELETKQTVLRIPDIGSKHDEEIIEEFKQFLEYHKSGYLQEEPAARYNELSEAYNDIEISFETIQQEYDMGDEAIDELKKLLNNERVTLAEIDETVLNGLKNLPEFSQLLTIQFQEGN
jgi:hypothetical protein